ncbi:ABC transporter permease [Tsuneonella deserti]|uniref:ABC transporter permease n=1 Tax=Tsuneonella deserti TaxID=2035528 RepID=UPI0016642D29|nr:FtsX-like permease family protein [Tsuneonella deserti]
MSALHLKLLRDLWNLRGQSFAIAVVLAAASATFILSLGVHRSLVETRDAYYSANRFAEVFADLTRAPRSVVERVAQIPGVQRVDGRIRQYATLDFPGRVTPARALINSIDETGRDRLNLLTLKEGRLPRPGASSEVVVDQTFAEANGLRPGSVLGAQIYGRREQLRIVGIGTAPDYIWALAPGDLTPDESRFGIFWMGSRALEGLTNRTGAINSLALTVQRGASIDDVIRAVDHLLAPYGGTGAYTRKDHISHAFLENELTQLKVMTTVIPPVFLLVGTFLVYIVLSRLIATQRTQIGLLKALGYTDLAIADHYLGFALAISLLGAVLGGLSGIWLGRQMTELYGQYYRFPFLTYHIAPEVIVGASALCVLSAGLGSLGGLRTASRLTPAVAMSPPPPPTYRAGLVERLGRAGEFSPIGNMIARHIARWPGRSAVTVFGVALAAGLLFATMQFLDSSRAMLDGFFFRAQRQDITVGFTEPLNEAALHELRQVPGVLRVEPGRGIPVRMASGNHTMRTVIESSPGDGVLSARIDAGGSEIRVPPAGLMLSRRLAEKLGVSAGDHVNVELLGGRRTARPLPVASVFDEFVGERAYSSTATAMSLARDASPVGMALLRIDPAMRDSVIEALKEMPRVLGVTERAAALEKFEQVIDENIFTMLFYYITFASAIAVGVVHNSARILFSERAHELATLRVLGYQSSEVGLVLMGEIAFLIVASVPLGCLLGYGLAQLMTAMFSSDLFRLPFAPLRSTYGWSVVIVLIAGVLTALVVLRRVFGLDMVRVLKARD